MFCVIVQQKLKHITMYAHMPVCECQARANEGSNIVYERDSEMTIDIG